MSVSQVEESLKSLVCEDGYRLCYRVWSGGEHSGAPIILLHGLMSHSGWLREVAVLLAALRLTVIGVDRRGSGLNEQARGDAPSRRRLLEDLRCVIRQETDHVPVCLAGWCWGAVLAVNAALEWAQEVRGLVLLAPGIFPSESVRQVLKAQSSVMRSAGQREAAVPSPIATEMFSGLDQVKGFVQSDALAQRTFTPDFLRIAAEMSLTAATGLARLTQPILLVLAANDQAVDNSRTVQAFRALKQVPVSTATLEGNHALQLEMPQAVATQITSWLKSRGLGA